MVPRKVRDPYRLRLVVQIVLEERLYTRGRVEGLLGD